MTSGLVWESVWKTINYKSGTNTEPGTVVTGLLPWHIMFSFITSKMLSQFSSPGRYCSRFCIRQHKVERLDPINKLRQTRYAIFFFILLFCVPFLAIAKDAQPSAEDPILEERVMNLARELRCLVCQNETLADSRADLAVDLRNQIREQMKAGKSDKEIIAYLTARYGDFVLYRPPVRPTTYLLWFGPFVLLLGGLVILFRYVSRRRELIVEQPLSAEEHHRAETLLQAEQGKGAA